MGCDVCSMRGSARVRHFADLNVRFECVAASIERAAAHWFSAGSVTDAVLASCAVPGLLPPVEIAGEHFLDGGLVRSVPIGRAAELGATRIFVLHVGRLEQPLHPPTRPWQVALVAFEIARRHQFEEEFSNLPQGMEVHVLPSGSTAPTLSVRYRNTSGVQGRINAAYDAASSFLDARQPPLRRTDRCGSYSLAPYGGFSSRWMQRSSSCWQLSSQ